MANRECFLERGLEQPPAIPANEKTGEERCPRIRALPARAADQGKFDQKFNPGFFHPGATRSYKANQLAEANVQLTFHENTKCPTAGFETSIMMEPDIALRRVGPGGLARMKGWLSQRMRRTTPAPQRGEEGT